MDGLVLKTSNNLIPGIRLAQNLFDYKMLIIFKNKV